MTPIISEQDPETGEWEIVVDHDDEKATLDQIAEMLVSRSGTTPAETATTDAFSAAVEVPPSKSKKKVKTVERDDKGNISRIVETEE